MVTYSQADITKFPTREQFARAVVNSFSTGTANVVQWVCCREEHNEKGQHYHLAIKLDRNQRWMKSKRYLQDEHGISVHYSNRHHNYYSAWLYVTKSDRDYLESNDHPDLRNLGVPRTDIASRSRRLRTRPLENADDEESVGLAATQRKKKRLSKFEVSEIIVDRGLKSVSELQALAHEQKLNGKIDLAEFIFNHTPREIADLVNTAWEVENATSRVQRSKKSRITLRPVESLC